MHPLVLLLALTSTLVLRSGGRIVTDGPVREDRGVLTFRIAGTLYTMPAAEIERIENEPKVQVVPAPPPVTAAEKTQGLRLRVSEEERKRLLAALEQNHSGTPAQRQPILETAPPSVRAEAEVQAARDASQWRREARRHQEAVLRAREDLALLEARVEDLRMKIQSLVSLGYKPGQFTYDTTQLVRAQEQIPFAELEVTRAERAYEQFRDDARREGVAPGWLR